MNKAVHYVEVEDCPQQLKLTRCTTHSLYEIHLVSSDVAFVLKDNAVTCANPQTLISYRELLSRISLRDLATHE